LNERRADALTPDEIVRLAFKAIAMLKSGSQRRTFE
jgi:hypothetical protein